MRLALFAEVDPNQAEGPLVWLASVAETLARQGHHVTVLLRARRRVLLPLAALDDVPGVTLIDAYARGWITEGRRQDLTVLQAADLLERLDTETPFDAFLLRGASIAAAVTRRSRFRGRLALYITNIPQDSLIRGWLSRRRLRQSFGAAALMLCQTPELETYLRASLRLPETLPTALLPPMVPEKAYTLAARRPEREQTFRLVYTGKFAPAWNTVEMTRLPAALAKHGITSSLEVAGGKILDTPDATFPHRMTAALKAPGVTAHGTLARDDALTLAANCHLGLSWRAPSLDNSLEISTKLLEYGALGLPVLCNPTVMHRRLLGEDYPLFVITEADAVAAAAQAATDEAIWTKAAAAVRQVAARHRLNVIGRDLATALSRLPQR